MPFTHQFHLITAVIGSFPLTNAQAQLLVNPPQLIFADQEHIELPAFIF